MKRAKKARQAGRLKIGDDWNAITIIALSQNNPLKAVAEFVENSIDAQARCITIIRGKEKGEPYLIVRDDGQGIPRNQKGIPDFRYVSTHVCDSIKRNMKERGSAGIQGEFGIGLLSFWTVGEELTLTSSSEDGRTYQMQMKKGEPRYSVTRSRRLFPAAGTELKVWPLLAGVRQLSGEKIQWYLSSELRDRIRRSGVKISVIDRQARKQFEVEPRQFSGRRIRNFPAVVCKQGEVYVELYLAEPDGRRAVGLYRRGSRVVEDIQQLDPFQHPPWDSGYLEGLIDASFLNLTPGTRTGVIHDDTLGNLVWGMEALEQYLTAMIEEQRRAEEEHASRQILKTIQKAFREALLALPVEEYDWFSIRGRGGDEKRPAEEAEGVGIVPSQNEQDMEESGQKRFFDYPGPLFSVQISPASVVVPVGDSRNFRAVARDRGRRQVEENLSFEWGLLEGDGMIENASSEIVTFHAPSEPCLTRLQVRVTQTATVCRAEALCTVTDSLVPSVPKSSSVQGLPGYTFKKAPGELWRSRYQSENNVIVINKGHRDFVYASRKRSRKLRYISRLFAKELVLKNFPGLPSDQLLERIVELSLYTEEHLK